MPQALDTKEIFRQNLVDAGCSPELVRQCSHLAEEKKDTELKRILSSHRKVLLDAVHLNEKRIDCLDYLLYTLGKHGR